jgi:2,5-diketo-D-gluconate reductase B
MNQILSIKNTRVPVIGFGTWKLTGRTCIHAVEDALNLGYRHIDTARMYENESEVGEAIRNSGIERKDIYLVSKIAPGELQPAVISKVAEDSLKKLKTDYMDLLLIHWTFSGMDLRKTLETMYTLAESGKVKNIGVSNFTPKEFKKSIEIVPVVCNQVLFHPFNDQEENVKVAKEYGLFITAYTPFAHGTVHRNPILNIVGKKYNKTAAQVTLRWLIQHGNTVVIPKAENKEYRKSNLEIFDFELDEQEMEKIGSLQKINS